MPRRRSSADSVSRTAAEAAYDRVTLHAFMFTLTVATAVALAYGPAVALHRIEDALSTTGTLPSEPDAWQIATAD